MDFKKEYKTLVDIIKANAKKANQRLTNEDIANRLGYNRSYFSQLLGATGKVDKSHIEDLMLRFNKELDGAVNPFPADDPLNWERAKIIALERRLALLTSMYYESKGESRTYEQCLDDIDNDTEMILADLRRSGKKG